MLGVSRAAAGEMLKRLEAEGLIERGEHKEAILTASGRERAERVVRKHRLIERMLTDFMGYTAAESHVHADELGDALNDDMVERIAERLGHPDRCPHGWPVDTAVEQAENRELAPLADSGRDARHDRPARRARRRPAALVLRPGPRAGTEVEVPRHPRRRGRSRSGSTARSAPSATRPRPGSSSGPPPSATQRLPGLGLPRAQA